MRSDLFDSKASAGIQLETCNYRQVGAQFISIQVHVKQEDAARMFVVTAEKKVPIFICLKINALIIIINKYKMIGKIDYDRIY